MCFFLDKFIITRLSLFENITGSEAAGKGVKKAVKKGSVKKGIKEGIKEAKDDD